MFYSEAKTRFNILDMVLKIGKPLQQSCQEYSKVMWNYSKILILLLFTHLYVIPNSYGNFFFQCNTVWDVYKNVHVALFQTMHGYCGCQAQQQQKKYNKSDLLVFYIPRLLILKIIFVPREK